MMQSVRLSSTADLTAAIGAARNVRLTAFVLNPGTVLTSLVDAAQHGADVGVTLAGDHFARSITDIRAANDAAARRLRAAGAAVTFDTGKAPLPTLHAKVAVVDGVGYLDERNWPDDGKDTILRDTDPHDIDVMRRAIALQPTTGDRLTAVKADALAQETAFVESGPRGPLDVETESFGASSLSDALAARARSGDHVRLMVVGNDLHDTSRGVLAELQKDGVEVRVNRTLSSEKAALAGNAAWVGSTNATARLPHQVDWGMVVENDDVVGQLRKHYDEQWNAAVPLT